jgi:hypothetical protein
MTADVVVEFLFDPGQIRTEVHKISLVIGPGRHRRRFPSARTD